MESVLITGASGFIGRLLSTLLEKNGYQVLHLSRSKRKDPNWYYWNIDQAYIDHEAIEKATYIVHLTGANIAEKRWTKKQKKRILNSRLLSSNLLYHKAIELNKSLKGFIGISGVGYYGAQTNDKIYKENDLPGSDFLAEVCIKWESSVLRFKSLPARTVVLRSGMVLSHNEGALPKMSRPIKSGLGAVLGSGNQIVPWIHVSDLCNQVLFALKNDQMEGIFNAVAPEHITNKQLTKSIAHQLNKKIFFPPVPAFILKLIFGEMASIFLEGSRVSSEKIQSIGFSYDVPGINSALVGLTKH